MVDGPGLTQGQGHARLHCFSWRQTAHAGFRHTTAWQGRQRHSWIWLTQQSAKSTFRFQNPPVNPLWLASLSRKCHSVLKIPFALVPLVRSQWGHKYLFVVLAPIFGNLLVFVPYRVRGRSNRVSLLAAGGCKQRANNRIVCWPPGRKKARSENSY